MGLITTAAGVFPAVTVLTELVAPSITVTAVSYTHLDVYKRQYTDFNDGFVMPAAIGRSCWVAAGPRADRKLVIYSEEYSETFEWDFVAGEPVSYTHLDVYKRQMIDHDLDGRSRMRIRAKFFEHAVRVWRVVNHAEGIN